MTSLNLDGHLANVRFIPQYERALKKAIQRYLDAPPEFPEPNLEGLTPQEQLSKLNRYWYELDSLVKAVKTIEDSLDTIQGLWRSAISDPELGSSAADQYALDMNRFLEEHVYPTESVITQMEAKTKTGQSRTSNEYRAVEAKLREAESSPVDNCETPAASKTKGRKTNLRDEPERPTVDFVGATTTPVMGESGKTVVVSTALRKAFGDKTQQGQDHNIYVLLDENGQAVSNTQAWVKGHFARPNVSHGGSGYSRCIQQQIGASGSG